MNIRKISIRAGQVRANPYEGYSNLQASITLEAELTPEDNESECVRELQVRGDSYVAQHIAQQIEAQVTRHNAEQNRIIGGSDARWSTADRLAAVQKAAQQMTQLDRIAGALAPKDAFAHATQNTPNRSPQGPRGSDYGSQFKLDPEEEDPPF